MPVILYGRHLQVPVYAHYQSEVKALHYNHVHVALNRLGEELRLELPGLRTLELILQRDSWIIVDGAFDDLPVAAWTDFEIGHRSSLHTPVACTVRLFHAKAEIILERVIEAMELLLGEQLDAENGDGLASVTQLDQAGHKK